MEYYRVQIEEIAKRICAEKHLAIYDIDEKMSGKGRIIKIAALGTSVFSILGGFIFNLGSLVFFRAMNGILGAGIFPVTMALIGSEFEDKERQSAMAKVMGLMFLGGASATVIGGALA